MTARIGQSIAPKAEAGRRTEEGDVVVPEDGVEDTAIETS